MVLLCLAGFANPAPAAPVAALQFDGVDDRVSFGTATNLSSFTFTLETWLKRTGSGVGANTGSGGYADAIPLIAKGRGEADGNTRDMNYILAIRAADSRLVADFEEGGSGPSPGLNHPVAGNTVLTNNGWYHAAVTYDGAEWRLYLNGALETNFYVGRPVRGDSIQHAALAAAQDSTGAAAGAFAGVLDEARIWNYARSAQEIADNFRREIVSANGLIGRWGLNEGSGLTVTNSGSAVVTGTLANGPVWVAGYVFASPPTIALTNPPTGTSLVASANVLLEAQAADADGVVTNVSFLADAALLGSATNAPFAVFWTNPPMGSHVLLAVATDDSGLSTTSAPVAIFIYDPIVQLAAPTNGARFLAPASVSLTATVTETNGPVTQVEFFAGEASIGLLTAAPWNLAWNISQLGPQILYAVATDASGTHTSAPVQISIATNLPPSVSISNPANNFTASTPGLQVIQATAADADGSVTQVAFFTNGLLLARDGTAPFAVTWTNPPLGSHTLTAVATDNDGATNLSVALTLNVVNARVTRGPYLQSGAPTSAIVRWRTDTSNDGRVRFGTDANFLTNFADEAAIAIDHAVLITGLEPETRYYYSVGSATVPIAASTNYFLITSPLPGTNRPVRAWVLGDAGTKDANQRAVRDAYYNFTTNTPRSDLILLLGDNAYQTGTDAEYQAGIFDIYTNVLPNTVVWSCVGNHDTAGVASPAPDIPYFNMFSFPTNGVAGGVASGTEKYYAFDFANTHFVCLDSMTSLRTTNGPMANWLRADLASTTQKWVVAFWHHPSYSKGSHDSDSATELVEMRQNLVPILEDNGVDLCLYGHSHNYERSILINGHYGLSSTFNDPMKVDAGNGRTNGNGAYRKPDAPEFSRGAVYVTAGTAGQVGGGSLNHPVMFMSLNILGSVVLDIAGDRLDLKFLTSAGVVQDYFTMLKGAEASPPDAPTNLFANLLGAKAIRLTWPNTPTNELGWELQRSLDGVSFSPLITLGANLTNYTNGALQFTTTYYYRLRATNSAGASAWSPIAGILTGTNVFPSIAVTAPTNSSVVPSGTNLTVTATASDSDGTVTNVEFFLNGFRVANDTTAPYNYTWSNAPLGNFTLAARAIDSDGATNWSAAVTVSVVAAPTGINTLIAQRSAWRYLDTAVDPGATWNTSGFNDSSWATGLAQLGYGDGDETTVIGFGPDINNRHITTWLRHAWWVDDPNSFNSLQLRLLRDDGVVVYINGSEVARQNMPAGTITPATLALVAVGGTDETTFFNTSVSAGTLVAGTNMIAVEIHQATANSSDVSFDLQLIGFSGNAGAPSVVRGPYLLSATTNSVVVRWRTDVATNSVVRFGSSAVALSQVVTSTTLTNEHAVTVSNLDVGSRYFYAIGAGTNILAGATTNHFFNSLPTPGVAKPTRLWVLGDSGTANASAQSVRNSYLNYAATNGAADFWLMLGDNAYNNGTDPEYQAGVFDMYPTVLRNCVLWPTIGNHDTAQQTSITTFPYLDIFTLPQSGQSGGIASGTKRYYAFDYANIHFICLDSMTSGRTTNTAMFDWLRSDLEATSQEWIIAFWHHPPYTKGSHNSDAESDLVQIRQNFLPLLESHGVDLVLAGHSHCYERSFLLNGHYGLSSSLTAGMKVDPGDGRTNGTGAYFKSTGTGSAYVVAGNGGQATGGALNHPAMFVSLNELGSLVIDVNSNRIDLRMLGLSGVRDTFTLIKQIAPTPQFERFAGQGFKARRGKFLQNGYLALTNAGPASSAGGAVSLLNDWVRYVPSVTPTNVDSFPFIVTNNLSRAAVGTATVSIATNLAPSVNFTVDDPGNGTLRLRFSGIPGRNYSIQFSNSLDLPAWQTLAAATADGSGAFEYVDTPPPAGSPRFYRTIQP